ncbi:MAG: tetratricopeptide repeat protein [Novosphingobium sp.]|nr:tetratricopeptide repeat protein [Novosphingobium sp.]MCP5404480.1 tetratricopeptide repeat protein [Novosphingobium sp.]
MANFSVDRELRRAQSCERKGERDEARRIYGAILEKFPNNARARSALSALQGTAGGNGNSQPLREAKNELLALYKQGRTSDVAERAETLVAAHPSSAALWSLLGAANKDLGKLEKAALGFGKVVEIDPGQAQAHYNLGLVLAVMGRFDEAIECYQAAIRLKPDYALAFSNLGCALRDRGRIPEAIESFRQSLRIAPGDQLTRTYKLLQEAYICDWSAFGEFERISEGFGTGERSVDPFTTLAFEDNPERQARRSLVFARENFRQPPLPLPPASQRRPGRIRVGYFSGDFHDHPTLYLMAGLFREHDRSRFEIFAYSYGSVRSGRMRESVANAIEHFVDIADLPDRAAIDLVRGHELDIAIDLKGYTQLSRSRLFARRLAPLQMNYVGYPGTMSADFIDYIVADPVVIPDAERAHYSEEIIRLPNSYQPNDNCQATAQDAGARSDFGLPEHGFVFCCFNQNYKMGPREFDIWMRLLGKVKGSVLWLFRSNQWAEENLRREAQARGVHPDRLVFAEKLPHAEHLARHVHADLFVDTFNYNAHTTASDALWAGLPIVTRAGRQFSARVAASLLTAVGLPELITGSEEEYEALILDLATDRERLAAVRAKLAENRLTQPLFDTVRYTRDFESALETVFRQHMQSAG